MDYRGEELNACKTADYFNFEKAKQGVVKIEATEPLS